MNNQRVYDYSFAKIYQLYLTKAERKARSAEEVDQVLFWLTGHDRQSLDQVIASGITLEQFFAQAPAMNPARSLVTGVICGVRIEEIEEPTMREIRIMDKLVDELANGRKMEKILRA